MSGDHVDEVDAANCQSDPLPVVWQPAVADVAVLLPADINHQALVLPVARQRGVADAEPFADDDHARDPRQ